MSIGIEPAIHIRPYRTSDLPGMIEIWNKVVEDGMAFPQLEPLTPENAEAFFAGQSLSSVAVSEGTQGEDDKRRPCEESETHDGHVESGLRIVGLYILHPNNVGRCEHVANASYAVAAEMRGKGIGRALVEDSLAQAAALGFRGLQFNAVVASNIGARKLYESLGFSKIGIIPQGFYTKKDEYEDIFIYYRQTGQA